MPFDPSLLLTPWALGILGLCIGSFLNVVIHRLPQMLMREWLGEAVEALSEVDDLVQVAAQPKAEAEKLTKAVGALGDRLERLPKLGIALPRSRCPNCGHQLAWHENLPVIGWLRLGGRCASCKKPISKRYPLVEFGTGLLFAALGWRFGPEPTTFLLCGFSAALIALAGIDWDTTLLPDIITIPLLWCGLLVAALGYGVSPSSAVIGAAAGFLSLWSINAVYKRIRGEDGMAGGDLKLLAALGAWLGWQMLLPIVLAASLVGAVVGLLMRFNATLREGRYVPFGPFLVGGALLVLFAGRQTVFGWLGWS